MGKKTETRLGYLRSEKDISYFITYIMTLLPGPITYADLLDICLIEEAFGYFEFKVQFHRLVEIGVIFEDKRPNQSYYYATKKCTDNADAVRSALPSTVRDKAQAAVARVISKIRRNTSIQKEFCENEDGTFNAKLSIVDNSDTIFKIELMLVNRRNVDMVFENFQKNAEYYYTHFINSLIEPPIKED